MKGETYSSAGMHLGGDARIVCHRYSDGAPILSIDGGGLALTISSNRHKKVDERDVTNARALAKAVGVYLAECERVYAETYPHADGKAAEAA